MTSNDGYTPTLRTENKVEMKIPKYKFKKFIFVVTGMSYIIDSSGTSKVVQAHEDILKKHGIGYVVIFPISRSSGAGAKWHVQTTGCYAFVIDGDFVSVMTAREVLNSLLELQDNEKICIGVLIHHIIRNNITEVRWILEKIKEVPFVFYLHNFYTCCINPNMLKNDIQSCVDGSVSCDGCSYLKKRQKHLEVINDFFKIFKDRITFVAPSEYTRNIWLAFYPEFEDKSCVILHQEAVGRYIDNKEPIEDEEPLKLGFVGAQTYIKGWNIFKKIVDRIQENECNYELYYFGHGTEQLSGVTNVLVEIAKQGKDAMIRALREKRISMVLLVCVCGETYSYAMFESHAANSYIFTMKASGNIAYTVEKEHWGHVFSTKEELIQALIDEKGLRKEINEWRLKTEPGALDYIDSDGVVNLFPQKTSGKIAWKRKISTPQMLLKRVVLNKLFIATRLNNGKNA